MNNKKAGGGILIAIIVFIVVIVGIITLFMVLSTDRGGKEVTKIENPMKLYLKAVNYLDENEFVDANYQIEFNKTIVKEGILSKDSVTEIEVPRGQLRLICWNEEYYLGRTYKIFTREELNSNVSKALCNMKKIGEISVTHRGEIREGESTIKLNITAKGEYTNLKICTRHTAGIISALPRNGELFCDKGNWMNWSQYNSTTKEYTMLPENYFRCGECNYPYCDWAIRCSSANGRYCEVYSMRIPNRYVGKVDNCYYPGKSLTRKENSVIIEYIVKASNLNPLDEIQFFIMDSDRRFNTAENMLTYVTEYDGINIGANDTSYIINYWNPEG